MALVAISTLYPDILPHVPKCPPPLVRSAVRNAVREFCLESRCWRATLTAINVVADTADYALAAPNASSEVFEVVSARYDDEPLAFYTEEQLDEQFPDWRTDTGTPEAFTILTPGTITLVPQPTTALTGGLEVRVALIPAVGATSVDSSVTARWAEDIVHGALARLKAIPNEPWTALTHVEAHYNLFRDGVRKAKTAASNSFQSRPRRIVYYGGI